MSMPDEIYVHRGNLNADDYWYTEDEIKPKDGGTKYVRAGLMAWQDIESAPKDGVEFLAYCPKAPVRNYHVCHWWQSESVGGRWEDSRCQNIHPTHWQPLPLPPKV